MSLVICTLVAAVAFFGCVASRAAATDAPTTARTSAVLDGRLGGDRGIMPSGIDEQDATYVTISRLARADQSLDGTLVTFRGEVVGEALNSSIPGYRWVLMETNAQTTSAVEVLMSEEQISLIENFGSYKTKGSTLRVTGIYRVADTNQSGQLDVTAYAVRLVDAGGVVDESVNMAFVYGGIACVAVAVVLNLAGIYIKWRSRS